MVNVRALARHPQVPVCLTQWGDEVRTPGRCWTQGTTSVTVLQSHGKPGPSAHLSHVQLYAAHGREPASKEGLLKAPGTWWKHAEPLGGDTRAICRHLPPRTNSQPRHTQSTRNALQCTGGCSQLRRPQNPQGSYTDHSLCRQLQSSGPRDHPQGPQFTERTRKALRAFTHTVTVYNHESMQIKIIQGSGHTGRGVQGSSGRPLPRESGTVLPAVVATTHMENQHTGSLPEPRRPESLLGLRHVGTADHPQADLIPSTPRGQAETT